MVESSEKQGLSAAAYTMLTHAGFDVDGALDRLRGNGHKLKRLILMYCESYRGLSEELRRLRQAEDMVSLQQQFHQIKGTAGNVGAVQVSSLAATLESQLKSELLPLNESDFQQLLELLEALAEVHVALSLSIAQENSNTVGTALDQPTFHQRLAEIRQQLAQDMANAMESVERLKRDSAGGPFAGQVEKIDDLLMSFALDELNAYIESVLAHSGGP